MRNATEMQEAGPPQVAARTMPPSHEGPSGSRPAARPTHAALVRMKGLANSRSFIALRSFAVFVALWYLLSLWTGNPIQLPSPFRVVDALVSLAATGEIFEHALISVTRLAISLAIALVLAVPLGFLMGLSREADALIDPLVELLRPISGIAWIPLGLFIFGVGDTLPVFIMTYVAFFPLLLNTISGVRHVDPRLVAAARTMGIGRAAMLRHVVMPAALPTVIVGFRLAFAGAWAAIVAAELIGSPSGLGFAIEWYRQLLMSPKVFGFIVVIGLVGYVCDVGLRVLQRRLTPWAEGTGLA